MDFTLTKPAREFGRRLQAWLQEVLPSDWADGLEPTSPEWIAFQKSWDRKLFAAGWGAIFWPSQYGGMDATPEQRIVFAKTMADAGAPEGMGKIAKRLLAPVLFRHGSQEQRARFLPPILRGEEFWAQGFSEPGSGSDLASLTSRGVVDGENLVINGHKVWTSHASYCDWMFILVRTSAGERKQQGISFVLVPTDIEGVRIEQIHQINRKAEFAEVFFEDARVPMGQVVGALGDGWRIAKSLLQYERGAEMAFGRAGEFRPGLRQLLSDLGADVISKDAGIAASLGSLQARYLGSELNALRLLGPQVRGHEPGHMSAVVKLQQTEAWRAGSATQLALLGDSAIGGQWAHFERYLNARSATIASGSSEIQREIIIRHVLGLSTSGNNT